jgi:hypothetical protein
MLAEPWLMTAPADQIAAVDAWTFLKGVTRRTDRITIYEKPREDAIYVIGVDWAYGIPGKDRDAACILCRDEEPIRQVGEIHGYFGSLFDRVLYAACMLFGGAFLCGERSATGLPNMQRIVREFGHGWMYYDRREEYRDRAVTDKLGVSTAYQPTLFSYFQAALAEHALDLRSPALIDQMGKLQWRPKTSIEHDEAMDSDLEMKLAGGGSPDLVMAALHAYHGVRHVHHFPKPKPKPKEGSLGSILGHEEVFDKDDKEGGLKMQRTPRAARRR